MAKFFKRFLSWVRSEKPGDRRSGQWRIWGGNRRSHRESEQPSMSIRRRSGLSLHSNRRIKFLLDNTTTSFRDAIVREGYEATRVELAEASHLDVLRLARDGGTTLLTLDRGYLRVAANNDNNKYGIIFLPENFMPVDRNHGAKARLLRELLERHEEVEKVILYPIRVYAARKGADGWKVEEVQEAEETS